MGPEYLICPEGTKPRSIKVKGLGFSIEVDGCVKYKE